MFSEKYTNFTFFQKKSQTYFFFAKNQNSEKILGFKNSMEIFLKNGAIKKVF
jgi:hypothetical protein